MDTPDHCSLDHAEFIYELIISNVFVWRKVSGQADEPFTWLTRRGRTRIRDKRVGHC